MRLPAEQQRRQRLKQRCAVLWCVAFVGSGICGCQGPQLDQLDGSPTVSGGTQMPVIDNEPLSAHARQRDAMPQPTDALGQSTANNDAAIAENLNCGHREAALNHLEQAEACYRKVLELDPEHAVANHRLAILLDRRGDFAASEKCYLKAMQRDTNDPDLWSDLGYSYFLQGRQAESERCLLAAVRANPLHQKALDNLSLLYAKLGDRDRAFEILKQSFGEVEARNRIARLFPGERPTADDEEITASFAPGQAQRVGDHKDAGAAQQPTTADASDRPATPTTDQPFSNSASRQNAQLPPTVSASAVEQSPLERQLADLMERERQRALEQRSQRPSSQAQLPVQVQAPANDMRAAPPWEDSIPQSSRPTAQSTASTKSAANNAVDARAIATGRVPDDRINDVFAAIDRENAGESAPASPVAPSPAASPRVSRAAPAPSWGPPTTVLKPEAEPSPPPPIAHWPVPAPNAPVFSQAAAPQRPLAIQSPPPAIGLAPSDIESWESATRAASIGRTASSPPAAPFPSMDPPVVAPNPQDAPPSLEATQPLGTSQSVGVTQPLDAQATQSKNGWNQDVPSIDEWHPGNSDKVSQQAPPNALSRVESAGDLGPRPAPRIVPLNIVPASVREERNSERAVRNAFDEFETAPKKPHADFNVTRSSDVPSTAAKPTQGKLPTEQKVNIGGFSDSPPAGGSRDSGSLRIEPRPRPVDKSVPNDFSPADKQPPKDKPASSGSDTDWSDLPAWQPQAPAKGSSGDSGSSPTILPRSP
jgi:tetratricopeptide (TPR) repeat protein